MEWIGLAEAVIGSLSLYLGYKLFCDRRPVLVTNLVAGALLAIFGVGILIADVRAIRSPHSDSNPARRHNSTEEGSYERFHRTARVADRRV